MADPDKGISRRSALKRIGTAGAIAWATPVIASLKTPAFAQTSPVGCTDSLICGTHAAPCGEDSRGTCSCVVSVEGIRICGNDSCGPACTSSADCQAYAPGAICQAPDTGCCGQTCIAPCGAFDTRAASARTSAVAGTGSNS